MALFDFLKGLTNADRQELDRKYLAKTDLPAPYKVPEGFSLLSKEQAEKLDRLENYTIPKGYNLLSDNQIEHLNSLKNYTPPKDYTAKYILVKQDGKSTPMEFEVFKTKPATLPENQINIIL